MEMELKMEMEMEIEMEMANKSIRARPFSKPYGAYGLKKLACN